jgi:hypothetical protein
MRTSLLSALLKELEWRRRTWTRRIDGDGTVIDDSASLWRLGFHEDESLFCALLVSSFSNGVERDVQEQQP